MELWIRSQDKTILTKINEDIYVYDNLDKTSTLKTDKWQLGTYATKERALEVLNEIQRRLTLPNYDTTRNTYSQYDKLIESKTHKESSTYVYEMPKE